MNKPVFKDGICVITDYQGRQLSLLERTWSHIIRDRNRKYFYSQFDKIARTLESPLRVFESQQEKNIVIYEYFFDDLYITNTVLGRAYVYVVVNWKTARIRTAYTNPSKRRHGKVIWETENSK